MLLFCSLEVKNSAGIRLYPFNGNVVLDQIKKVIFKKY